MKFTVLIKFLILILVLSFFNKFVYAGFETEINLYSDEIEDFIGNNSAIIFVGEYASPTEIITLDQLQKTHFKAKDAAIYEDLNEINITDKVIILIGGSNRNSLSREILNNDHEIKIRNLNIGLIRYIITDDGQKYIIFSDAKSESTIPNTSTKNSPLKGIIPDQYIPATAVAIGATLLWLWHILAGLILKIGRLFISEKIMNKFKKKNVKEKGKSFKLFGIKIKYREFFSILGASIVFAIIITYTYFTKELFVALLISNIILNAVIYGSRNLARLLMDKKYGNHTEYTFWTWGAIVTILTGWLGYTLSMAGYISKHKNHKNENQGFTSFIINLVTFIVSIIFFVINLFYPNIVFQMAAILSITIAFIQTMPFKPFSGVNIFKWRKIAWFLLFISMLPIYVLINLI